MCLSWEFFRVEEGFFNQPRKFQGSSLSTLPWPRVGHEEPALGGNMKELVHLNSVQGVQ